MFHREIFVSTDIIASFHEVYDLLTWISFSIELVELSELIIFKHPQTFNPLSAWFYASIQRRSNAFNLILDKLLEWWGNILKSFNSICRNCTASLKNLMLSFASRSLVVPWDVFKGVWQGPVSSKIVILSFWFYKLVKEKLHFGPLKNNKKLI